MVSWARAPPSIVLELRVQTVGRQYPGWSAHRPGKTSLSRICEKMAIALEPQRQPEYAGYICSCSSTQDHVTHEPSETQHNASVFSKQTHRFAKKWLSLSLSRNRKNADRHIPISDVRRAVCVMTSNKNMSCLCCSRGVRL